MRDATVLGVEQDLVALEEGEDPTLGLGKDIPLVSPVPGAGLPLGVDVHAPRIRPPLEAEETVCRHALKVEQDIDTPDHDPGVGATHDHVAGIIHVPEEEQGILDLEVDHRTQCQRPETGRMCLTSQTTMKD